MVYIGGCYERAGNTDWCSEYAEAEATPASSPPSSGTQESDRQGKRQANQTVGVVDPRSLTREGLVKLLESTGCFRVLAATGPADMLTKASEERISVDVVLVA